MADCSGLVVVSMVVEEDETRPMRLESADSLVRMLLALGPHELCDSPELKRLVSNFDVESSVGTWLGGVSWPLRDAMES